MSHSNITQGMSHVDTNSEGKAYHEHADKKANKEDHPRSHSEKQSPPLSDDNEVVPPHSHEHQTKKDTNGSTDNSKIRHDDHKKHHE